MTRFGALAAVGARAGFYWLGLMFEDGLGRERDAARARAWMRRWRSRYAPACARPARAASGYQLAAIS